MPNPKLSTVQDAFTAAAVNTTLWNINTAGAVTLDTVNDQVLLAVPTASGTNTFGTSNLYDATGSQVYAQIGVAANGNGTTRTVMQVRLDANNTMSIRIESGVFRQVLVSGGSTTTVTLPTYDPHAHRWWRLRESAGVFYADTSPDGLNWTNLASMAYTWDATQVSLRFQSVATATEAAGNASVIAHINTPLGGPSNPNWPTIEDGWGPYWNANAAAFPFDRYTEVTDRTRGSVSVQRGRQYETDQVRSGEASLKLANTDAALDPVNTSGPWYGHIAPYQPYRRRAQWPPTRNLLTQVQATGGDVGGYATGSIPTAAGVSGSLGAGTIATSAAAWQGGRVFDFPIAAGGGTNQVICRILQPAVAPSAAYTHSVRVRNVAATGTIQVKPYIAWYTAGSSSPTTYVDGGTVGLVGSTTAAWTTFTVTATAPANAAGIEIGLRLAAESPDADIQIDGWQLEKASTASTWTCPGVWYPVYAGWTERWPSSWDMDGLYGVVEPNAVDSFSLLSQQRLSDPLTQEINSNAPRFVYKLDDPAGSTAAADWTGNYPAAQLAISKYGAGSLTFGNSITATSSTGTYTGGSGTVVSIANANPGTNLIGAATFLKLTSAGITGPTNPALWTRMIAFRYTGPTPTAAAYLWSAMDTQRANNNPSGAHINVYLYTDGKPVLHMQGPDGTNTFVYFGGASCVDGNWHLLAWGYSQDLSQVRLMQDGVSTLVTSVSINNTPTGIAGDNVGGFVDITVGNGTTYNFQGDISFAAEFPSYLSATALSNLYSAWKSACAGESTNARYARILRYAGYTGGQSLQTGLTTSMGPANIDGQDAVSALQAVVDTENGAHFVDANGDVQFKARSNRYNNTTPAYTFGERTDLGEWPYEDCKLDFDSTHLSNQVTVTQESTSQAFYATDDTSLAAYFPRPLSRTINSSDAGECQDAANYLLSRYRQPAQRVSTLTLHPSANPALWPVCLALELGTRARVMRRPPGAPTVQVDCYVENLAWDFGNDGEARLILQCSPADLTSYGLFAAWHATLNASISSGVTSITINASADNTNPLAAQLAPGQQLTLGQNTANTETVTVSAVGATSPGWTTATITLTAATTKAHTAGDTVCEVLPAGTTDPTKWDAVSKFDSIAFAY